MNVARCPRAWQAEALTDGRLAQADAASWQRHAAGCAVCRRELAAFAQLNATAERLPVLTSTPLEQRRLRNELLRRAHQASTTAWKFEQGMAKGFGFVARRVAEGRLSVFRGCATQPRSRRTSQTLLELPGCRTNVRAPRAPRLAWLGACALACALLGSGALWLWSRQAPEALRAAQPSPRTASPAARADLAPAYEASGSADAIWYVRERGRTLRLVLERGRLELDVAHLRSDQRFLVALPDGELEVKGTRFLVQADAGRTRSVHVIEGRVALRLRDQPEALLSAGQRFAAPPVPPPPSQAAPPAAAPRKRRDLARAVERTVEPSAAEAAARDVPRTAVPAAESTFTRAMTAFNAGDFARADALFAQFAREQAADARVEDALFLRAVARDRRGDRAGARQLAREYLARFPHGLRRRDAERLAR